MRREELVLCWDEEELWDVWFVAPCFLRTGIGLGSWSSWWWIQARAKGRYKEVLVGMQCVRLHI